MKTTNNNNIIQFEACKRVVYAQINRFCYLALKDKIFAPDFMAYQTQIQRFEFQRP